MAKVKSFVLSDESVNTYGFRLLTSGCDLEQFRKNPVMFYNHDEWDAPIGRWENVRIEDGKLLADPVFDLEDERGRKISGKVDRNFLRAASVGLRIVEQSDDPGVMIPGQKYPTVTKWQLREASIVGIGANHNAIRLYDANDNIIPEDEFTSLFDKPQISKRTMNKEIFKLLDVPQDGTEEQIQNAIKALVDKKNELEADLQKMRDAQATREEEAKKTRLAEAVRLVDDAVKEGRLTADGKEEFLKFFAADHAAALKALSAIPKRVSIKTQIEKSEQQETGELADLTGKTWDELDHAGKLQVLKDKYPDVYAEKFEKKYGKKPATA